MTDTLIVEPFLHAQAGRIDNPITGATLAAGDARYAALRGALDSGDTAPLAAAMRAELAAAGWLIEPSPDLARRFRLRIVSLETQTVCNQACDFCPVSVAPRAAASMPGALFDRIVGQLTAFRDTLEAVFLFRYNEPTLDPRLLTHVRRLMAEQLPVAINTNATGLTPARIDQLVEIGPIRFLSVNLSTLDRARYARERGADHLDIVLRNLDYARDRPVAAAMVIVVMGAGDDQHQRDLDAVRARFAGSRFVVEAHRSTDRAGYLTIGLKPDASHVRLAGCSNLGSRPLEHLHVTPAGLCVLCCQDYDERHVVGDLGTQTIEEVLRGDALARLRRWTYGLEASPQDFMCRRCVFALTR